MYAIALMPDWISKIKKGDVLETPNGKLRIVRAVRHYQTGPHTIRTSVHFAIQQCSWTGRCYTVYTDNDLRQMGYRPVQARWPLKTKFDKLIEREFSRDYARDAVITCCDVRGIA